jgi:hypothetical protein
MATAGAGFLPMTASLLPYKVILPTQRRQKRLEGVKEVIQSGKELSPIELEIVIRIIKAETEEE